MSREIADAIEKADWSGASIGNKALLTAAVAALRAGPAATSLTRNEILRGLAEFFSESVHHVWDKDEIASCLTDMTSDAPEAPAAAPTNPTRELTAIAAECHRVKWQFDLSEDFQPSKSAARALILQAFHELHRIGDLAMKARDAVTVSRPDREAAMRVLASD